MSYEIVNRVLCGHPLRSVTVNDRMHYHAGDVITGAGLTNVAQALKRIPDEYKAFIELPDTMGRMQRVCVLDSRGTRLAILCGRKKECHDFRIKVVELIEEIDQKGFFAKPEAMAAMVKEVVAQVVAIVQPMKPQAAPKPRATQDGSRETYIRARVMEFARVEHVFNRISLARKVKGSCGIHFEECRDMILRLMDEGHIVRFSPPHGPERLKINDGRPVGVQGEIFDEEERKH